jgi:Alginate lyase
VTMTRVQPRTVARVLGLLAAALCMALSSCSTPPAPSGEVPLAGWNLTLPVAGKNGDAATVTPAAVSPPWLTVDGNGCVLFWAPVNGVTTPNSEHARTELVEVDTFPAGSTRQALAASVVVTQVPTGDQDVIIGQIHGAGDISAVPFVMLHYRAGTVAVVVKQQRSGSTASDLTLLTGVPLGDRFEYGISDNGDGNLTFTANYGARNATMSAPVPASFSGATVRFQAGAYQQASSKQGTVDAGDGARVTFCALSAGTGAPTP